MVLAQIRRHVPKAGEAFPMGRGNSQLPASRRGYNVGSLIVISLFDLCYLVVVLASFIGFYDFIILHYHYLPLCEHMLTRYR
jgi:hypothetical protein